MIKVIIVDFGGVLVPIPSQHGRLDIVAEELGVSLIQARQAIYGKNRILWERTKIGKLSEADYMAKIGKNLRIPPEKVNWIKKTLFEDVTPNAEFIDYLKSLHGRYRLAILSNAIPCATEVWKKVGFMDWCELAINSSQVGLAKPDPEIFHLIVQRLGVKPENCLFVDDQDNNIEAASALGFHTVQYLDERRAIEAIQGLLDSQEQ